MSSTCIASEKLYERDAKLKREDVKTLQEWLSKQPHLPKLEETQVILFLHSCYYSLEATKITIDKYFTRKTRYFEIFQCTKEAVNQSFTNGMKCVLPTKTPEGYTIYMMTFEGKAENFNCNNDIITGNSVNTLYLHKSGFSEGLVLLFDLRGVTLGYLTRVNLSACKQIFQHFEEGQPVRLKQIHAISIPIIDKILALVRPLMSKKLYDMIQLHASYDELCKYVPRECLPKDDGGKQPSREILKEHSLNEIMHNLDFFEWHDSQRVDESKRVEASTIAGSGFGVDGTFKKLQLD